MVNIMRFIVDFHSADTDDFLTTSLADVADSIVRDWSLVGTDVVLDDGEGHSVRGCIVRVLANDLVDVSVDWTSWEDERLKRLAPTVFQNNWRPVVETPDVPTTGSFVPEHLHVGAYSGSSA